eukprot:CAMPEP_0113498052 /NCGR_PEP_ID=MMETSP0014_2-20120614/30946_1 /TAXON_ID=2857 /ORGANISM="Nitzschia sp." /LENGTH=453 /DNA_ID=CAMNT_0000392009 /DNA_START=165 /DNA_END=1526 /DNA_ORIENTATION=+ /assembly_acc=CAM_ASM_000159
MFSTVAPEVAGAGTGAAATSAAGSSTKSSKSNDTKGGNKPRLTADQRFYGAATASTTAAADGDSISISNDISKKLQQLKSSKPWMKDPTYFKSVALSPSAVTKMMMHCSSGVTKGVAKGGNPIEVMGLLLGRLDPTNPTTLIVADAFPLPIEGFETRVVADDQDVVNHMISLTDCLARTRTEHIMGWYHSHPFDLEPDRSHCFLSQTDLSTQLLWQRAEDPQGNPFVAVVLDPLRSQHLGTPELKAFRVYPPEYSSPVQNQCPDGTIIHEEQVRLEHWGSCWNRYYELGVEYYMSSVSRQVLGDLTQNYLWMKGLQQLSTSETKKIKSLTGVASQLQKIQPSSKTSSTTGGGGGGGGDHPHPIPIGGGESSVATSGGTGGGSSAGNTTGGSGTNDMSIFDSAASTIRSTASQELIETQFRQVQKQVFATPAVAAVGATQKHQTQSSGPAAGLA